MFDRDRDQRKRAEDEGPQGRAPRGKQVLLIARGRQDFRHRQSLPA